MKKEKSGFLGLPEEPKWDADVLVVGGGSAGMMAAITAADEGAEVILLEKMPDLTKSASWKGTAIMSAACTKMQLAQGILHDLPMEHYKDAMRIGEYKQDPELLKFLVENSAAAFDWLCELGVPFVMETGVHEAYRMEREYHPERIGSSPGGDIVCQYMEKELSKRIERGNLKIYFENRATNLITDEFGAVIGVKAVDKTGEKKEYLAKATILTTGGFISSRKARKDFIPYMENVISEGAESSTGDGLYIAKAVGAAIVCLEKDYNLPYPGRIPNPKDPSKLVDKVRMYLPPHPGAIWIDKNGKRFCNELTTYERGRKLACVSVPDQITFVMLDEKIKEECPLIAFDSMKKFNEAAEEGLLVTKATTIEELAKKIGVNPTSLKETITKFNSYIDAGKDPDFGRTELKYKIENPPFYAIKTVPGTISTKSGLKINTYAEVLNINNKVIPGLYAAGEVVAYGLTTGIGVVGGSFMMAALVFGKQASREAVRYGQSTYNRRVI